MVDYLILGDEGGKLYSTGAEVCFVLSPYVVGVCHACMSMGDCFDNRPMKGSKLYSTGAEVCGFLSLSIVGVCHACMCMGDCLTLGNEGSYVSVYQLLPCVFLPKSPPPE